VFSITQFFKMHYLL